MSNPFAHNSNGHAEGHPSSGSQLGRFFTSYDEILDRIEFGISFECGCEVMTVLSLDQARMVHDLFDNAILAALHHKKGI
ncbi:hypothetical protein [Nocardia sp. NPDC127526]|uniref:hypothetical protein n=1 Tax=Nocardia sp. NPDC127526 TaxID=3345393 RepID=UPI003637CF40